MAAAEERRWFRAAVEDAEERKGYSPSEVTPTRGGRELGKLVCGGHC